MIDGWITAPLPANEQERLQALYRYHVLDTLPEEAFDRITRLASSILKTPIALVSLVDGDRQWFKSHYGIDATQTPRDLAFCAHAILQDEVLVVPNTTRDNRFRGNPLVTGAPDIRFYAGAPLKTSDGFNLGTLCVIDRQARADVSPEDRAVLRDLAALVIDELELRSASQRAAHASQAKSRFIANVSHEIRTPMNVIMGFASMLKDTPLNREQQDLLGTIQQSGEALLDIINDVLDISKIESGKIELEQVSFNIRAIADDVVRLFALKAAQKDLPLLVEYSNPLPECFIGDQCRIRQIVMNLVSNAVKFTQAGQVKLSVAYQAKNNVLRISVEDTGIGIKAENIQKIFEEFSQEDMSINRRYGGTGLGLAISRRLLEMMGSALDVVSEYGKGTRFSFTLTLPVDSQMVCAPAALNYELGSISPKVLVVEDLPLNQLVARNVLQKLGCTVDAVLSGQEAIEAVERAHYDVVFMDMQMPEMDGLETTRRIRARETGRKNIIVAMTASALNEDRQACIKSGMDDFVSKPLQADLLRAILHKYVKASPAAA